MLVFDRKVLLNAVKAASRACARKSYQPALLCVKITASNVVGTDGTTFLDCFMDPVEGDEQIITPARRLMEILNGSQAKTIKIDPSAKTIAGIQVDTQEDENFPKFPMLLGTGRKAQKMKIQAGAFARAVSRTAFILTPREDVTGFLLLNEKHAVATDSVRMSVVKIKTKAKQSAEGEASFQIPSEALKIIRPILNEQDGSITVMQSGDAIMIANKRFSMVTKAGDLTFPRYLRLLPKPPLKNTMCIASRKDFLSALKLLKTGDDRAFISVIDGSISNGKDSVPAPVRFVLNDQFTCNQAFLTQLLESTAAEEVNLDVNESHALLAEGGYRHVLCGMQK
jgi:DNA polymerase III sliding clamp (beta) subunit (PCNA family)